MSRLEPPSSSSTGLSRAGPSDVPHGARAPQNNGSPWPLGRPMSTMSTVDIALDPAKSTGEFDPDELFTMYTVSEVRRVQQRLRVNAEAKQEELRLMVGERYRDLLQASSSIISMAASSRRVLQSLEEMREIIDSTQPPRSARRINAGEEDKHIQALQSLSAHLKLLLDAPEHLWRFIEQRMYLRAAWLFLTARVVHRTLLQEDEDVDQSWHAYGIDVLEQLPLVQRQWDSVSQLRSQITHKATLSLREHSVSSGEICATLLTLHILESRPLSETLTIFLAQRMKTLTTVLSQSQGVANGHVEGTPNRHSKPPVRARKAVLRQVKQNLQTALDSILHTMRAARDIFSDVSGEAGMMTQALQYIQQEKTSKSLTSELQLTTQTLLNSLPSSAHFSLLPASIRAYKPYVGATTSSPAIPEVQLQQKLNDWFSRSVEVVQVAATKWSSSLDTIKGVWDIRTSSYTNTQKLEGLEAHEKSCIQEMLDGVCQRRIVSVWKSALVATEVAFQEHLTSALDALRNNTGDSISDSRLAEYLFQTLPLPSTSQVTLSPVVTGVSFDRYKAVLRRQLHGRTPFLHDVLNAVEQQSQSLQEDLGAMAADDLDGRKLVSQLLEIYHPDALDLCSRIIDIIETAGDVDDTDKAQPIVSFVGRLQYELASSSQFIFTIGCNKKAMDEFRKKSSLLHEKTFERWRENMVQHVTDIWPGASIPGDSEPRLTESPFPDVSKRPSTALMQALLLLSSSLQGFGPIIETDRRQFLIGGTLKHFTYRSCDLLSTFQLQALHQGLQFLWDLAFLRRLTVTWGWPEIQERLDGLLSHIRSQLSVQGATQLQLEDESGIPECLSRMQIIFATLFPPPTIPPATETPKDGSTKSSNLLCYSLPAVEQQFQSTLELVKPSARFGLLLVGNAAPR